ncbi:hypothetical protein VOLCADRAFT_55031 [Volvox carteri f. nagariensis]|uniref:S-acyltransferase n=1 Tax=Volvox carteri f. nagariensis TaxID=3068 RepID=D8TI58_VOLCA|nr:uncharacterized protein VOLCADRAFT_55031 [Volvox carteri f. nagariensis]EFJ52838.1 hypothetical protein VOLCADRAFT_55031 [Volvox carteri f. nagariensis]|eukprot:XP_002945843.1 hypothetical protein VOLCADRAFT_55031 [Volvox carteri f. nagariensis]
MAEEAVVPCTIHLSKINVTVLGVLCVFGFLYYVSVFCVIVPWLSYSVPGITNMGVLTVTTCLSLYCYMFCVMLDAGRPPPNYQPDQEASSILEVKRKDGAPRYCQKCQQFKPPRSHHCRKCQRCVLRMDHHCPWTNNCIGHANYRAFFLFLICEQLAVCMFAHVCKTSSPSVLPSLLGGTHTHIRTYNALAFAVALPLTISLLLLFVWHVQLVMVNKTTIEYQEGVTASINAAASGAPLPDLRRHPYDLGLYVNLMTILGSNPAVWPLPPCAPTPGGTSYSTKWDLLSAADAEEHEARLLGLT